MKKSHKFFGSVFLLFMGYTIYSHFYSAPPISGVITDATTGQPVEGTVVLADWISERSEYHSKSTELFETQETLTDKQGRYVIPGFKMKFLWRIFADIARNSPEIVIYKYGYLPRNTSSAEGTSPAEGARKFPNIEIKQFLGTPEEKSKFINDFLHMIPTITEGCYWKERILLVLEADKQVEELERYVASHSQSTKQLKPWFSEYEHIENTSCPGAIETITNARKIRNKVSSQ